MSGATVGVPLVGTPLTRLEEASGQNLFACYQCGKCSADCPFSLSPSLVVRYLQLGDLEAARDLATTWECAGCMTCETGCPKGVSPYRIMKALRAGDATGGSRPVSLRRRVKAAQIRLRSRLLASMPSLFRLGSAYAPWGERLLNFPGAKWLGHAFLGIHKARPLPPFAPRSFPQWFEGHVPVGDGHRGDVLLFHDTAMDFSYPAVGVAATELLEKAGFRVRLTETGCCGRPAITKGFEADAARCARANVERLYGPASQGLAIVGCEPSCLLSFRDEYPHLVPEIADKARLVASRAFLLDEFLANLRARGELELKFREDLRGKRVLFHGHCHQKAKGAPARSIEILEAAGYDADLVNAACCGLAGSYGFEREHYQASREAGERSLFPALRAGPDTELVVMGVSCRQQVEHFTGRRVRHLAEALREAVI